MGCQAAIVATLLPRTVNAAGSRRTVTDQVDMANASLYAHAAAHGRLLLVAAAVLWSTSGLLVKSPPLAALSLGDRGPLVACFRALIAAACLLPFVNWRRVRFR